MKIKKWLVMLLLVPAVARAEFVTGNDLLSKMRSSEVYDMMYALGYVLGVHDSFEGSTICTGSQVTAGQTRDVVKRFLENNPGQRDMSATVLSIVALMEAFPCKEQKGKRS